MNKGFYTALGTPLDAHGSICKKSFTAQIRDQIKAGSSGLLVMGSMGIEAYIRNSEYAAVAACGAQAANGEAPVLVGVMDTSIGRVMDRVDAVSDLKIDGVVSTVPYYSAMNQAQVINFYTHLADQSRLPVYLYDLAVVTKTRIMPETVRTLWKHPNIRGIKSGNLETVRILTGAPEKPDNFDVIYSDLDTFDVAYAYGIEKNLDGMFASTPKTATRMYSALAHGDRATATAELNKVIALRNLYVASGTVMGGFTCAMNALGYEGNYAMDYDVPVLPGYDEQIRDMLRKMGEV